jgi:multidrug efflux pump subunit AcrA (membrane-fusion protein)
MRKRIAFVLSAALSMAAVGCSTQKGGQADSPAITVQTATAATRQIEEVFHGQGILYPIHQASLSPKITAPVERFYVNRGSHVHAGQLLAVLANQDLTAGVISARGAYDQALANYATTTSSTLPEEIQAAEAAVADAKSNLENEERIYQSELNLYHEGGIPRKQVDTTAVALTAARSVWATAQKHLNDLKASGLTQQQRAAKGQMESAHGQYLSAVAQKGFSDLRSPIDGVVADRAVYPGDIAPAGTPLLVVMDTSKVILRLHIPQSEAAQVRVGDAATLDVPGISGGVPAKVSIISPALDPGSTTVEIWLEANNPDHKLMPGTSVGASIILRKAAGALVIPDPALLVADDGTKRVMVLGPDSTAFSRPVTTGIQNAGLVQITSGLRAGDQVIVGGAYGLPDKTKVKAVPEKTRAAASNQD